jgi:hypothetical protein
LRTIDNATRVLGPAGLQENPTRRKRAAVRVMRTAKDAAWVTAMDWTRGVAKRVGVAKKAPIELKCRGGEGSLPDRLRSCQNRNFI